MPRYQISAPDGNTYQIDGPAGASNDEVRAEVMRQHPTADIVNGPKLSQPKISTEGMPPAEVHPQSTLDKVGDYVSGVAANAIGLNRAHDAASAILAPISGYAGIAGAALPGPPGQGERWVHGVQSLANYVPHTDPNAPVREAGANAVQATGEAAGLSPANAGAILPAAEAGLTVLGGRQGAAVERANTAEAAANANAARAAAPEHPVARAMRAGFEASPSEVAASTGTPVEKLPGSTIEANTETPLMTQQRLARNVTKGTNIAAEEIGAPKTDVITPEHIAEAKKAPGATYDRTGALVENVGGEGRPQVKQETIDGLQSVIDEDKQTDMAKAGTRKDVQRIITGLKSGKYPGSQVIKDIASLRDDGSPAALRGAESLEAELGNQLQDNPKALADYTAARQQFAKIYDVEAITQKYGGRVNFAAAKSLEHTRNRPLTGGLAEISNAGAALPESTAPPSATKATAHQLEKPTLLGIGQSVLKAGARKVMPAISSAAQQEKLRNAVPVPGQLPVGPPQAGIPNVRQLEVPGGAPGGTLEPPPGPPLGRSFRGGPAGQGATGPEVAQRDIEDVAGPGGSPAPFAPPRGKVGPGPLGSVLARNAGRLPTAQLPPEAGTATPPPAAADLHPAPGRTATNGPQPLPVPAAGVQPPEGQLPRRLGDFLRGGGSEPLPSTAPASPKAKPEGGDAATERLFEEAVARDAERAHAANAKNGGKTKRQLGEELARRSARRASDANGE
jgi:hypothetical protein